VRVLGVDPGTAVTGYGVIETGNGHPGMGRLIECGVIKLAKRGPLPRRLHELHEGIVELIARHRPTALALEDAFYHKNVRTTLVLGHARGVVLLAAQQAGLDIAEYPPATIKKTVAGAGGAATSNPNRSMTPRISATRKGSRDSSRRASTSSYSARIAAS